MKDLIGDEIQFITFFASLNFLSASLCHWKCFPQQPLWVLLNTLRTGTDSGNALSLAPRPQLLSRPPLTRFSEGVIFLCPVLIRHLRSRFTPRLLFSVFPKTFAKPCYLRGFYWTYVHIMHPKVFFLIDLNNGLENELPMAHKTVVSLFTTAKNGNKS